MEYKIRPIQKAEYPLLEDFLYEAIYVPEGMDPPPRSILAESKLQASIAGFGTSVHDLGVVAEVDQQIVGAAWARIAEDYGHVDDETPSLAISVYPAYRGQGIGTKLLQALLALLKERGYRQVSLSVQKANYAVKMYQRAGFQVLIDRPEEYIMIKKEK